MKTIKTIFNFLSSKKVQLAFAVVQYLFAAVGSLHSQCNIPNGSFETWYDYDTIGVNGEYETIHAPADWCDFYCLIEYPNLAFGLEEMTPGAAGTFSALKVTPGVGALGIQGMAMMNLDCTERPDKLTGFYKFTGLNPGELVVLSTMYRYDPVADTNALIGVAAVDLSEPADEFVRFEAAFEYLSDESPETAQIFILPSTEAESNPEDYFVLDELQFEMNVSDVNTPARSSGIPFEIFPVPATEALNLRLKEGTILNEAVFVQIFNSIGQVVYELKSAGIPDRIDIGHLRNGVYLMKVSTPEESWSSIWMKS